MLPWIYLPVYDRVPRMHEPWALTHTHNSAPVVFICHIQVPGIINFLIMTFNIPYLCTHETFTSIPHCMPQRSRKMVWRCRGFGLPKKGISVWVCQTILVFIAINCLRWICLQFLNFLWVIWINLNLYLEENHHTSSVVSFL